MPQQLQDLWNEYQASKQPDVNALWQEYQATKAAPQVEPQDTSLVLGGTPQAAKGFGEQLLDANSAMYDSFGAGLGQMASGLEQVIGRNIGNQSMQDEATQTGAKINAFQNKTLNEHPIIGTLGNLAPKALAVAPLGISLPGIIGGGAIMGATTPSVSQQDYQNYAPDNQPVETWLDQIMSPIGEFNQTLLDTVGVDTDATYGKALAGAVGAGEMYGAGKGIGAGYNRLTRGPATELQPQLRAGLFEGSPDTAALIGEDIGKNLKSAGQAAKNAQDVAYKTAEPAMDATTIAKENVLQLADNIESSLKSKQLDPKSGTGYKRVADSLGELRRLAEEGSAVKYSVLEKLRQRINAIAYTSENAAVKTTAKGALDSYVKDLFENGLIKGDPESLALINEARAKSAYYKQTFTGKEANNVIRNYIKSKGESLTPENLADMFSRVGQMGFDNSKAAIDILGGNSKDLLKESYLTKLRTNSLVNGELNPTKLGENIVKFIDEPKNQSLVKLIFEPKELIQLRNSAKTGISAKTEPNLVGKAIVGGIKRTPLVGGIGDVVEGLLKTARDRRTLKNMQKVRAK